MRFFLIAVLLSLSACVLAQEAKQGRTVNIELKSAADVALKKAEVLEKTAQAYTNAGTDLACPMRTEFGLRAIRFKNAAPQILEFPGRIFCNKTTNSSNGSEYVYS